MTTRLRGEKATCLHGHGEVLTYVVDKLHFCPVCDNFIGSEPVGGPVFVGGEFGPDDPYDEDEDYFDNLHAEQERQYQADTV